MSLHNYENAWRSIGRDLAELLTAQQRRQAADLLDQPEWARAPLSEWKEATALLGLDPKPFRAKWAKIDRDHQPLLWLRLQFLVHLSTNAIAIAETAEDVTGLPYRKALRSASERLLQLPLDPSADDLRDALL
ncbi:hypothetical protein [Hephaestia caeni]|uniref:hypothetical protein n=1 Tax=Hephaestia caeni TaxID=645617 RepID=UPI0011C34BE2|nr:hypothetical protein [Hephaestia caeni]